MTLSIELIKAVSPELVEGRISVQNNLMYFWCYMLLCADGHYYVGHTDNLDQRVWQHQNGTVKGYTHKRRPVKLVWSQSFLTRDEAKQAEHQIKGWSRAKKEALIAGDWERISRLAKSKGQS